MRVVRVPGKTVESDKLEKEGVAAAAYRQILWVAGLSLPVVRFVKRSTVVFGVAGLLVWILWFFPSRFAVLPLVGSVIALAFLAVPAVVYALFARALEEVVDIPKMLRARVEEGGEHVAELSAVIRSGVTANPNRDPTETDVAKQSDAPVAERPARGVSALIRLARSLYRLGRLGVETKGALMGAATIVRLGNPVTLLTILIAGLAGGLLAFVALIALIVAVV